MNLLYPGVARRSMISPKVTILCILLVNIDCEWLIYILFHLFYKRCPVIETLESGLAPAPSCIVGISLTGLITVYPCKMAVQHFDGIKPIRMNGCGKDGAVCIISGSLIGNDAAVVTKGSGGTFFGILYRHHDTCCHR